MPHQHLLVYLSLESKLLSFIFFLILLENLFVSISFFLITPFIPCLNSSTDSLHLYPLSFTALLNFCTNFSIILLSYSAFFNFATFIVLSSPLLNSFFKSSKIFTFQISARPPYTYNSIYWICFFIVTFFILIFIVTNFIQLVSLQTVD